MSDRLKPEILKHLKKKLGYKSESIQVQLSLLKRKYSGLTLNAAAQVYALKHNISILPKLSEKDKSSLNQANLSMISKREIQVPKSKKGLKTKIFLVYNTVDRFVKKHIEEINNAYSAKCYTATYILCRKVIENLIIEILKKQFPHSSKRNLYEDTTNHRFLDFSVVLDNLFKQRTQFSITAKDAIERLKQTATPFRKDANSKTHSLFHIASKTELDNADVQTIFELIVRIRKEISL